MGLKSRSFGLRDSNFAKIHIQKSLFYPYIPGKLPVFFQEMTKYGQKTGFYPAEKWRNIPKHDQF